MLLAAAFGMTLASSAYAIEDQDPVGAITVGAHGQFIPGFGGNAFMDYVIVDSWWRGHFTVGAQVAYSHYGFTTTGGAMGYVLTSHYTNNRFAFAPRATYGLNILPNLEVHAGVLGGIAYEKSDVVITDGSGAVLPTEPEDGSGMRLVIGEILGARYFFTDNFGASLEFNYATYMPYINVGVAYRF